jgi:CheY-like chemotaxis protein
MTLTAEVAANLPLLRRFARAITGSQTSGDAYVAAMLETLISDLSIFPATSSNRVSLYQLFLKIYHSANIQIPEIRSPFSWEKRALANLAAASSRAVHAFLLNSIEGFSVSEIGEILMVKDAEVNMLLKEATREISLRMSTNIMIIEDEPLIALDIEQIVTDLGHKVTGIARTHKEAIRLFEKDPPSLILADIRLADGSSGIEATNEILENFSIPVIFITAFPERLLTGERAEPTFLVTKPYNPDMVRAFISQALFFEDAAGTHEVMSA